MLAKCMTLFFSNFLIIDEEQVRVINMIHRRYLKLLKIASNSR